MSEDPSPGKDPNDELERIGKFTLWWIEHGLPEAAKVVSKYGVCVTAHPDKGVEVRPEPRPQAPLWARILGAVLLSAAILFFMGLVVASLLGHHLDKSAKLPIACIFGLVLGVAFGYMGGTAGARGAIRLPKIEVGHFAVTDGIAGVVIGFLLVMAAA